MIHIIEIEEAVSDAGHTALGEAKQDVFDYIEMFNNPNRRHSFSNDRSPVENENSIFNGCRVSRKLVAIQVETSTAL